MNTGKTGNIHGAKSFGNITFIKYRKTDKLNNIINTPYIALVIHIIDNTISETNEPQSYSSQLSSRTTFKSKRGTDVTFPGSKLWSSYLHK